MPRLPCWLLGPALVLLGCPTEPPTDDDDTTTADDDDDKVPVIQAQAAVSEAVSAVIKVTWTIEGMTPESTWVEFGTAGELDQRAVAVPGGDGGHEALVWGVKPGSEVTIQAVAEADGQRYLSDLLTATTGYPPAHLPQAEVTQVEPDASLAGFLITSVLTDPSVAVVIDGDGDYVWWHTPVGDTDAALISRVRISLDGRTMVYLATTTPTGGGTTQELFRLPFDGAEVKALEVAGAHHDFVERNDGNLALIALDGREVEGEHVQGEQLVEMTPDGMTTTIWSAWDHFEYDPDDPITVGTGWTHANALDHDAVEDIYFLALRNRNTILAIDRATSDLLSMIGGPDSDYLDPGGSPDLFEWPHQFQMLDGAVLAFSSGSAPWFRSEALEYTLDKATDTAELVWSYTADPPLFSVGYGDVSRLLDGRTMVTWSAQGRIDIVDEQAIEVWRLNLALGGGVGYVTHVVNLPGLEH
jgi:hypothetical protein